MFLAAGNWAKFYSKSRIKLLKHSLTVFIGKFKQWNRAKFIHVV